MALAPPGRFPSSFGARRSGTLRARTPRQPDARGALLRVRAAALRPPGLLDDLKQENLSGWQAKLNEFFTASYNGSKTPGDLSPRPQFFNPADLKSTASTATKKISWTAFPKQVKTDSNGDDVERWREADRSRDVQDEYCEWSVTKDKDGNITRVTFTCEAPEYWEYLAEKQPDTVLELYRKHVSPQVQKADLFDGRGKYVQRNRWNRDTANGAMHLIQRNNTLSAEIELAAGASVVRLDDKGAFITNDQELIVCGQYGQPRRFSDPTIGAEVNELARAGWKVTVNDPVALYFDSFSPAGSIKAPDGADVKSFMKWTRGANDYPVRGVFEVPAGKPYTVSDLTINVSGRRQKIRWGGQLADFIAIKLVGLAADKSPDNIKAVAQCVGQEPPPAGAPKDLAPGTAAKAADAQAAAATRM